MIRRKEISLLTDAELEDLKLMIEAEKEKRETESVAISEIKELMLAKGLSEERLAEALGVQKKRADLGRKAPVKFRHPKDKTKEWSGRGKRPAWYAQALTEGFAEDDLKA